MNVTVLGCGRWGTFLGWYCQSLGHNTTIWGRQQSVNFQILLKNHKNDYLTLSPKTVLSTSLANSVSSSDYIIISISAQELRNLASQLALLNIKNKVFILCMKGLEADSGKRLSQVFKEEMNQPCNVAVWVGPGHAQDFVQAIPNCMVISSASALLTEELIDVLNSDLIRFYASDDMIGVEIGAAAKNVIGIAAGMLDGLHYSSLKGALMARGAYEISKLITAMGGNGQTAYGLSHLGDYEATLFSPYSHNRKFGEYFVQKKPFVKLAEGASTVKALLHLAKKFELELPISMALEEILFHQKDAKDMLLQLFLRPLKREFK